MKKMRERFAEAFGPAAGTLVVWYLIGMSWLAGEIPFSEITDSVWNGALGNPPKR